MKYGNDDQGDQVRAERERARTRRWIQLGVLPKFKLVAEYTRLLRKHGAVQVYGGPRTRQDYISAILLIERAQQDTADHLAEYGPGHEQCPWLDFKPICEEAKRRRGEVSRETGSGDGDARE